MDLFRHRLFQTLCALFVAFVITGDIVADGLHDASGACASESQDAGHDSCPACAQCTFHTGAALAHRAIAFLSFDASASELALPTDDHLALGAAPSIDHPPQLA